MEYILTLDEAVLPNDHNKSRKIKFITKDEWLPNSPELSPMDYFANGKLKNILKQRQFWTGRGLTADAKKDLKRKIPLKMVQDALLAWPKRVHVVEKAK